MNLIVGFEGYDGALATEILDSEDTDTKGARIRGNRIEVFDDEGRVVVRAELQVVGKTAFWRVSKGKRGQEIGIATEVRFSI